MGSADLSGATPSDFNPTTPRPDAATGSVDAAAVMSVRLGSPYRLFDLGTAHRTALDAVRAVYGLQTGLLAERIDAGLAASSADREDLRILQSCLAATERPAFWTRHWAGMRHHYEIELGTQVLLRPPALRPAALRLLHLLADRGLPTSLDIGWSQTLREVVLDTMFSLCGRDAPPVTPPSSPPGHRPFLWIGAHRDRRAELSVDRSVVFPDQADAQLAARAAAKLGAAGLRSDIGTAGSILPFPAA